MSDRKGRIAKLAALPVLAVCGFLAAATFAGVGFGTTTPSTTDTSTTGYDHDDHDHHHDDTTTPPPDFDGCTPGYWKSTQHHDEWTGLTPGQTLESVFDVPDSYGIDLKTLDQALGPPGSGALNGSGPDGVYQLLRHATAGILNANHPDVDYPFSAGDIVAAVNFVLVFKNKDLNNLLKDILASANERGCPLN